MTNRPFSKATAVLLALVSVIHLARLLYGWRVEIEDWTLPMWTSVAGFLIAGALAVLVWYEPVPFVERRRNPRRHAIHLASLRQSRVDSSSEVGVILGRTLELSPGGATLETREPLEVGAELDLELAVEAEIVEARGTVVHVKPDGEGHYSVGVKFSTDPA